MPNLDLKSVVLGLILGYVICVVLQKRRVAS